MEHPVRQSAIRWPGLAAFLVIVALLVAFSWLLLDQIIKWTLESTAGRLNGAEVNITSVEHGWMPLSLQVRGIEVTDPLAPEFNRVQVAELRGDIAFSQLLVGRVVIEQLNLTGVRVNQPREAAGEVYQSIDDAAADTLGNAWQSMGANLPSLDEVMAQVELSTGTVIEAAKQNFAQQQTALTEAREALPSEDTLAEYEAQVKAITESDIKDLSGLQQKREQLAELKEKFSADREAIQAFKTQVVSTKDELQADLAAVREAPQQDLEKIRNLMTFDGAGLENVTALIFGEQIRQWSKYVLLAYEQLAPMLERSANETAQKPVRGEGVWVTFTEEDAPPEFLIKQALTEFAFGETVLDVTWQNITHQHQQLGQPTTFQARANNTNSWDAFNLNGELSVSDAGIDARQNWELRGAKLDDLALSDSASFSATLLATLLDSEGSVAVRNSALDGNASVRLAELSIAAEGEDQWAQLMSAALGQLNRLDIRTELGGTLSAPSLSLNSDLDRQLGDALKRTASGAADDKLAGVREDLQAQVDSFLADQAPALDGLVDLENLAATREGKLDSLLESQVKNTLEDKLKDSLLKRLGGG